MAKRFFGKKIEVEDGDKAAAADPSEERQNGSGAAELQDEDQQAEGDTLEVEAADEGEQDADSGKKDKKTAAEQEKDNLLEAYKTQAEENRDKYLRAVAELENVQKRHVKERSELTRYAGQGLAADLVEIVDDLERAAAQDPGSNVEEVLKGVQLIKDRFIQVLERHSVKGQDAMGVTFDPKVHDALASVPTKDYDEGTVIEQLKKAYFFKDKLLRPAQVVVAVAPAGSEEEKPEADSEDSASQAEEKSEEN